MLHLKARIAGALSVAAASLSILTVAVPANALTLPGRVTGDTSLNWAGYFSLSSHPISEADASFVVPKVNCSQSGGSPEYEGVMWVGIGGMNGQYGSSKGGALKQDGIAVYCTSKKAAPIYFPFWEVVPGKPHPVQFVKNATVQPGTEITATVDAPSESPVKGKWYFTITSTYDDVTTVWTAADAAPVDAKNDTAEAITERNAHNGLVDLGKVTYTNALYYTGGESAHSIASKRLTLVAKATVAHIRVVAPMIEASPAYQPPGDDLKDGFTTSYAHLWNLWI